MAEDENVRDDLEVGQGRNAAEVDEMEDGFDDSQAEAILVVAVEDDLANFRVLVLGKRVVLEHLLKVLRGRSKNVSVAVDVLAPDDNLGVAKCPLDPHLPQL